MAIVPRTLNIKAPYCKKVSLKHCIMKARNSLKKKKIGRDRDLDVKTGGIKRKKQTERGKPVVDPPLSLRTQKCFRLSLATDFLKAHF